ncbi:hypothetical protein BV210_15635 [Halorientalis sp. IM1011]|uniref:hypothetical protein n=1 Tax=Halorientalis sp. IM1011 TaxID=1932360 RepID=UPI00097CC76D|nr:hypothetical protein [Halorientalis sp. IM1011]AQL44044.1 hypothetical protein BV210_15635 [Halorientalis sp. IM1011]
MSGGRGNGRGAYADGVTNISDSDMSFEGMGEDQNFSMGEIEDRDFEFEAGAFEADFESRFGEDGGETQTPIETDPRATELMTESMKKIQKTYEAYVGQVGSDANLMNVNASIESFNAPRIRRLAQEARDPLEEATEYAPEDQKNIILSLVQVTIFLEDLARVREQLNEAHDEFRYAVERLYAENTGQLEYTALPKIKEHYKEGRSLYRPLKNEIDPEAVAVFEPVGAVYDDKIDQVRAEIWAFQDFHSGIRSAANALEKFEKGVPAFYNRNYEQALSPLNTAEFRFGTAQSDFGGVEDSTGMQEKANEVADVMGALEGAAQALHRAAEVKVEDEAQPQFYEARRAAERAVHSNEIASDMRTASQIIL